MGDILLPVEYQRIRESHVNKAQTNISSVNTARLLCTGRRYDSSEVLFITITYSATNLKVIHLTACSVMFPVVKKNIDQP